MKTTPLQAVKDRFGDKAKLVAAVKALATDELWLDRVNEDKGLERVSNAKLLRLLAALEAVKKEFGSRAKLVDSILSLRGTPKDQGRRTALEGHPLPRLLDAHRAAKSAAKAAGPAKPKAAAPAKKKASRSKKAKAKAAAKK
ncbi:MAG: hypothetical protein FJ104_08185 [Deltaproteobacteria bacterium]|nr:hypothetical protein [Deltaproteobacteria bacterium]